MTPQEMNQTKTIKDAELVGITFGLMDDKELQRRVAYTLSDNPNIIKKTHAQIDSATDTRSGTTRSDIACSKCGKGPLDCQGHLGRFKLAWPCTIGLLMEFMPNILQCFCWRCSAFMVPETHPKLIQFRKLNVPETIGYEKAIKLMSKLALNNRICGMEASSELLSPQQVLKRKKQKKGCGAINPVTWIRFVDVLLRPVWEMENPPIITMNTIYSMLQNIKPEDNQVLGFHPTRAPLSALVVQYFIEPPILSRSSRNNSVDDLTSRLDEIHSVNKIVRETPRSGNLSLTMVDTGVPCHGTNFFECREEEAYKKTDRVRRSLTNQSLVPRHLAMLWDLQRKVAGFTFSKLNQKKDLDYGRTKGCVSDKFTASPNGEDKGIMRGNLVARRADFSARAPVSPDSDIDLDCVGVPISICKSLTKKEIVTKFNYNNLLATVLRGQEYPGANTITRNGEDYEIPNFADNGLQIGDIVHRHLIRGDWVLVNRQPTLHRYSMMALRVVPMLIGSSFRVSPLLTTPYAMDYDGDEMNLLVTDEKGTSEAMVLMAAGENMFRNGTLIIQLVQHSVLGAYLLTNENTMIDKDIAYQLCMITRLGDWLFSKLKGIIWPISGRLFLSLLVNPFFYNGTFQVNKSSINVIMGNMIQYYGNGVKILSGFCRLFERFARMVGTSLSFRDCFVEKPLWLIESLDKIKQKVNLIEQSQKIITFHDYILQNKAEDKIKEYFDKSRDIVGKYIREQLQARKFHPILDITQSGSKGNAQQVLQVTAMLGQQLDHSNNRLCNSTPHESHSLARGKGYIENSYSEGLNSQEFYSTAGVARDGLVDTATMIRRSGYLFRRMCKALEDCFIACDNSVRTQTGLMILHGFGFDTTHLKLISVEVMNLTKDEISKKYYFPYGQYAQQEIDVLLAIRNHILHSKHLHRSVALPLQWNMLSLIIKENQEEEEEDKNLSIDDFADLIRLTVATAWKRLVLEFNVPSHDLIHLSFQENLSAYNLIKILKITSLNQLTCIVKYVSSVLAKNISCHGTPIGPIVAEDFCAPVSQMSLKSFHYAGSATALSSGLDRIEEILTLTKEIATPSMKLYPKDQNFNPRQLVQLRMIDIATGWLDHPFQPTEEKDEDNLVTCCILLNKDILIEREISPQQICEFILQHPQMDHDAHIQICDIWDETWWITIQIHRKSKFVSYDKKAPLDCLPKTTLASNIYYKLTIKDNQRLIAGVKNITDFYETTEMVNSCSEEGDFIKTQHKIIVTRGSNIYDLSRTDNPQIVWHKHFHTHLTKSNDIVNEIYRHYGIDAACKAIEDELVEVMLKNAASVSRAHIKLIASFMCISGVPCAITFAGMTAACTNKLKLCTYEHILKGFKALGISGHQNNLSGTSEAIIFGKPFALGTGVVKLLLQKDDIYKQQTTSIHYIKNYPIPPTNLSTRDITYSDVIKEYMKLGGKRKIEEIIPKPKKSKESVKKVKPLKPPKPPKQPKAKKEKKIKIPKLKQIKIKKQKIPAVLKEPRRQWIVKKKKPSKQKKINFQNDATWTYSSIFQPSDIPLQT